MEHCQLFHRKNGKLKRLLPVYIHRLKSLSIPLRQYIYGSAMI
jgi:hypothetical protein